MLLKKNTQKLKLIIKMTHATQHIYHTYLIHILQLLHCFSLFAQSMPLVWYLVYLLWLWPKNCFLFCLSFLEGSSPKKKKRVIWMFSGEFSVLKLYMSSRGKSGQCCWPLEWLLTAWRTTHTWNISRCSLWSHGKKTTIFIDVVIQCSK